MDNEYVFYIERWTRRWSSNRGHVTHLM